MAIARQSQEWRVAVVRGSDSLDTSPARAEVGEAQDPPPEAEVRRFATRKAGDVVVVQPRLANRSVVARPQTPVVVPAGDEVRLFISTPIWVQLALQDPSRVLDEFPALRPTDTWLGPHSREGVAAYASRTAARMLLDSMPLCAHRAVTRVTVVNGSAAPLPLPRVVVPAPSLQLFVGASGYLWTQPIQVTLSPEAGQPAKIELGGKPLDCSEPRLVSEAREADEFRVLHRVFDLLFG